MLTPQGNQERLVSCGFSPLLPAPCSGVFSSGWGVGGGQWGVFSPKREPASQWFTGSVPAPGDQAALSGEPRHRRDPHSPRAARPRGRAVGRRRPRGRPGTCPPPRERAPVPRPRLRANAAGPERRTPARAIQRRGSDLQTSSELQRVVSGRLAAHLCTFHRGRRSRGSGLAVSNVLLSPGLLRVTGGRRGGGRGKSSWYFPFSFPSVVGRLADTGSAAPESRRHTGFHCAPIAEGEKESETERGREREREPASCGGGAEGGGGAGGRANPGLPGGRLVPLHEE